MELNNNIINKLHKDIKYLKQQVEDKDNTIKKLRDEVSKLKQVDANQKWVELND